MSRSKLKKIGLTVAAITFFAVVIWQFSKIISFAEPLSAADATQKVQDLYKGKIVEVTEQQNSYRIEIKLDTGNYLVTIDRKTGDISSMERTKKDTAKQDSNHQENPIQPAPNSEKQTPQNPAIQPEEPARQITEEEAVAIALQNVSGVPDDEIELEQLDGVTYFLVEIKREVGEDGIVQINAITGEVKSITWDD